MKTLVILFADYRSRHIFDKGFLNDSSFDLSVKWAKKIPDSVLYVLTYKNESDFDSYKDLKIERLDSFTVSGLFEKLSELCEREDAEKVVYSYADLPFLNEKITETLIDTHVRYKAEYTFADGYPYGFSPEIIDRGTLKILSLLSKENQKEAGLKEISRSAIFDFIKLDINSFEIEVEVSDEDLGLLRLSFDAGTKTNFLSSVSLFEKIAEKEPSSLSTAEIIDFVKKSSEVYKNVPSYYNIQISAAANYTSVYEPKEMFGEEKTFMSKENYSLLLKKISDFSEEAVVNPNLFGEPLCHPDFIDFADKVLSFSGLSLLIETDGFYVTEELCMALRKISDEKKGWNSFGIGRITWIVRIDSFSDEGFRKIHSGSDGFSKAVQAVKLIGKYFPGSVYPQFVRNTMNEDELEGFWRYWNEKSNGSGGNVLVQKYSSFCGTLPDLKSADLSPLERNACYHLRRDFCVFVDGSVPSCREKLKSEIVGNAFNEDLAKIFSVSDGEFSSHLKKNYCEKCGKCDEYYTFNF